MAPISNRLKHAWNAFNSQDQRDNRAPTTTYYGPTYSTRPDRMRYSFTNERTIISSILTRISVDVAGIDMRHVRVDDEKRYQEDMDSGVNDCLTLQANIDQGGRAFRQDIVMTLLDKGVAALVPVDTTVSPIYSGGYDINTMRVGEIVQWYPQQVRIALYNETTGVREEITLPKSTVAIVDNPLYAVMNEPNSTLKRLLAKLTQLDAIDEQSASGKLDLIIQLPYVIKSEARRQQADQRRKDIEFQLKGSQYGVAYTDGTEKITQLNRPATNNLMDQIVYLTTMLYGQLGITEEVLNGTADEATMLNYMNRTVEPILDAISEALIRTFLTKTARTQGQTFMYFKDVFKLVPLADLAAAADIFSRNEITSANEIRGFLGMPPSSQSGADKLQNSNMPQPNANGAVSTDPNAPAVSTDPAQQTGDPSVMGSAFDDIDSALDSALSQFGGDDATP